MDKFIFDRMTNIFFRPGSSVNYSDGSEEYLLNVFRQMKDLTSYSSELRSYIKDWPTLYHLSLRRPNILRACSDVLDSSADVLELGSGCGAITRWLGEHFRSVDAIESSRPRALATRERTKDLPNVKVFCGDMLDISFRTEKYGLITLIGVMEYIPLLAGGMVSRENACISFLKKLKATLAEDGLLMIAIENKFGAKYFCGCTEDHTNRLFEGLVGYPNNTAVTFARDELQSILYAAGFENVGFYHVFPDYKLPATFIKEDNELSSLSLYNWIKTPFDDYSGKRLNLMPEPLFIRNLVKAGLIRQFSNSFLVLAGKSRDRKLSGQWLIKKFSNNEKFKSVYHNEITLVSNGNGSYVVNRHPLSAGVACFSTQNTMFTLAERDTFVEGDLLIFEVYNALASQDGKRSIIDILLQLQRSLLTGYSIKRKDDEGYELVDGSAVDFVAWNLIRSPENGSINFIDKKWRFKDELPVDFILFRSLAYYSIAPFVRDETHFDFILGIMTDIYPDYSKRRLLKNLELEASFQSEVRNSTCHKVGLLTIA